eukprot:XP_001700813.1 U2 snRNA-like protein [Chlamydomonas reinhardtii]
MLDSSERRLPAHPPVRRHALPHPARPLAVGGGQGRLRGPGAGGDGGAGAHGAQLDAAAGGSVHAVGGPSIPLPAAGVAGGAGVWLPG